MAALVALAFLSTSCGGTRTDLSPQAASDSGLRAPPTPLPPGTFELDYSLMYCATSFAGLRAGGQYSHAFSLILTQPRRSFVECATNGPDLVQGHTFFHGCDPESVEALVIAALKVGAGDSAWVDDLDIELAGPGGEPGGMCYGYRAPGGSWSWEFAPIPPVYDQGKQRLLVHFAIHRGPVDALMVATSKGGLRRLAVTRATFTARPFNMKNRDKERKR